MTVLLYYRLVCSNSCRFPLLVVQQLNTCTPIASKQDACMYAPEYSSWLCYHIFPYKKNTSVASWLGNASAPRARAPAVTHVRRTSVRPSVAGWVTLLNVLSVVETGVELGVDQFAARQAYMQRHRRREAVRPHISLGGTTLYISGQRGLHHAIPNHLTGILDFIL